MRFFDSNVLIYAFVRSDPKFERALEYLEQGGAISVQCLNEFASVALRKYQFDWVKIRDALATIQLLCFPVVPLTLDVHQNGLRLAQRYKISLYDAMIVSAALEAGCDKLYSEDLQHGLVIEQVLTVENPFR